MRTRIVSLVVLPFALAISLAACGSGGTDGRVRTASVPTGAGEVVFRIDSRGGYTSAEYQLSIVPQLTVYGDGRVIVTGPVTEQYPPNALPNLLTGNLRRAEVQRLAQLAADLDLLSPLDFGQPGVTDLPTTTVTINVDGRHEQSAYAFGFDSDGADGMLTRAERDARERLAKLTDAMTSAATDVATEPFAAAEVAVNAGPAPSVDDLGDVTPNEVAWPIASVDLATSGTPSGGTAFRCTVLTGADARTALDAAADATAITRWESGDGFFTIAWRPLLPDEHDCP